MKYRISLIKDLGKACTVCLTYIILFTTVLTISQDNIPTPFCLIGIPFILIYYLMIQHFCFQPILYIFFHIIAWIPVMMIPFTYMEYRYLYVFMLILENIHAIKIWRNKIDHPYEEIPWPLLTIVSFLYIATSAQHMDNLSMIIYYLGLGILVLHFIRLFITGLNRLLSAANQATTMPLKKIIITNTFLFLFFLIILFTLCIITRHSDITQKLSIIGQFLTNILRFIVYAITYIITLLNAIFAQDRQREEIQSAEKNLESAFGDLGETSLLAQILDAALMIFFILFITFIIFRIIVFVIKAFTKQHTQDTDLIIQLSKPRETVKLPKKNKSFFKRIREFFKNDNASKVRRGYRLKIKSYKPAIFKKQDTPTEISTRIKSTYNEDISELTQIYEKARYSNEEITFEDVQKGGLL